MMNFGCVKFPFINFKIKIIKGKSCEPKMLNFDRFKFPFINFQKF